MRSMFTVTIHIFKLWAQNGDLLGQIGKNVRKLLNYGYKYTNSDFSSPKT